MPYIAGTASLLCLTLNGLCHGVQGTAVLEPLNLGFVERMLQWNLERGTILGVDDHGDGFAHSKLGTKNINL